MLMLSMSSDSGTSRTSRPRTCTEPPLVSQKRASRFAIVLLPLPEWPTSAYMVPGTCAKLTPWSTSSSP